MEQAEYLMWMKRRSQIFNSSFKASMNSINNSSWEEKAFAEDASGHLGGCIWPPRSYSCSFCNREFRSAQALGGHMNVHRRDRARLKQSFSPRNHIFQPQIHTQDPLKSLETHFPTEFCALDYSLDPNYSGFGFAASSTLSSSRVSSLYTQESSRYHNYLMSHSSSIFQEQHKQSPYMYNLFGPDSKPEVVKNSKDQVDSTCLSHDAQVETDLFMGLNSVIRCNSPTGSCADQAIICKRHKSAAATGLSFLIKPCSSSDRESSLLQSEVIGLDSSSMEDIDLELRLGEPPKMK